MGTFGLTVKAYKQYKLLPAKANLREHMMALTSLSEATAIELHRDHDSQGFSQLRRDTRDAGNAAGKARQVVEETLGRSVVSSENFWEEKEPKKLPEAEQRSLFDES